MWKRVCATLFLLSGIFALNLQRGAERDDYRVLWNAYKRVAAKMGLSAVDKAAVFHDTAAKCYKLLPASAL